MSEAKDLAEVLNGRQIREEITTALRIAASTEGLEKYCRGIVISLKDVK